MSDIMTVQGLDLWYGDHQALHDISMNIPEKSITALIGPSTSCGARSAWSFRSQTRSR